MAEKDQNEEDPKENPSGEDDSFGLPEIEYQPINREEGEPEHASSLEDVQDESVQSREEEDTEMDSEPPPKVYHYVPPKESSKGGLVFLIIFIFLLLVGGGGWYFWYKPKMEREEMERIEARKKEALEKKAQAQRDSLENIRIAREQFIADSIAQANAHPPEGTIEMLSERTGKYYVVVSSNVDDDLIMDYANRLSKEGVSSKIIPPFRNVKFYRLTIGERDSYAEAQAYADQMKSTYGDGLWVIKY